MTARINMVSPRWSAQESAHRVHEELESWSMVQTTGKCNRLEVVAVLLGIAEQGIKWSLSEVVRTTYVRLYVAHTERAFRKSANPWGQLLSTVQNLKMGVSRNAGAGQ
jgi:hypothetical protein